MNSLAMMAVQMACLKKNFRAGKNAGSADTTPTTKTVADIADSNPLLACAIDARSMTKQSHRRAR